MFYLNLNLYWQLGSLANYNIFFLCTKVWNVHPILIGMGNIHLKLNLKVNLENVGLFINV